MNETINLHLPQFEETDRIMHGDFNDAFAAIDAALAAGTKIAYGSYTGTGGTYNNGMHLTFPFRPRLVAIFNNTYPRYFTVNVLLDTDTSTTSRYTSVLSVAGNESGNGGTASGKNLQYTLENNTFSIISSEASWGLNESGMIYHYVVLG